MPTTTLVAPVLAARVLVAPALAAALAVGALTGAPAHAAATCDGRAATIEVTPTTGYATAPVEGTPGDDVIVGTDRRDTIDGGGGHDVICGLAGDDSLAGGPGDDRLFGGLDANYFPDDDYWGDVIAPGPGDDHVDLGADPASLHIAWVDFGYYDRVDYSDAPGPVVVDLAAGTATGEGTDSIVAGASAGVLGSAHDDEITGSTYNDWLVGAGGDDVLRGLDGKDVMDPDGTDRRPDPDMPATSADDDDVDGGSGNDMIVSYGGRDRLAGGPDKDYVVALAATRGSARGGPGNDSFRVEGPVDVSAGSGRDRIDYALQPGFRAEIDGDGGRDRLRIKLSRAFGTGERVRVDRPRDRMTVTGSSTRLGYAEIEQLYGSGGHAHWTFVGTRAAERVWIQGGRSLRAFARGGNDDLRGTGGRDLLDGGQGRDRAHGSSGRDTCVAVERARDCEVRR